MSSGLQDLLERHVARGTVAGVVASLGTAEPTIVAAGVMSVGGAPLRADAIMRLQSMTRPSRRWRPWAWSRPDAWAWTSRWSGGCLSWRIDRC
jgi:hypothetical protein